MALVTDAGEQWIAGLIRAQTGLHLAIGTNSPAAAEAETQTALVSEVGTRVADTTGAGTGDTATFQGTFGANNPTTSQTIGEYGLLTASTGGTLIVRHVEASPFTKATTDSLDLAISVQIV